MSDDDIDHIAELRAMISARDERIRLLEGALRRWLDADDAIQAIEARDAAKALLETGETK